MQRWRFRPSHSVPHMSVGLLEVSFPAVASVRTAEAGKNGYRFGFWSTTPNFDKFQPFRRTDPRNRPRAQPTVPPTVWSPAIGPSRPPWRATARATPQQTSWRPMGFWHLWGCRTFMYTPALGRLRSNLGSVSWSRNSPGTPQLVPWGGPQSLVGRRRNLGTRRNGPRPHIA